MTIASDTVIDTYGIDGQVHFELNEDFNLVSRFVENGSDQEILVQDTPKELSNISNIDTLKKYLVKTHSKMSKYDDGSLHLDIYRKLDGGVEPLEVILAWVFICIFGLNKIKPDKKDK